MILKTIYPALTLVLLLLAGCGGNPTDPDVSSSDLTSPSASPEPDSAPVEDSAAVPDSTESSEGAIASLLPDTKIIPGERVGPITSTTTRQELAEQFGETRLTDEEINIGEGFTESGTRVNLGPEYSFTVIWTDATQSRPLEVRNLGTAWETPQGIGIGTSFSELQQVLGNFELYGFAWDYGGTVLLDGTQLAEYAPFLIMRVQPASNVETQNTADYQAVTGDTVYASSNPHFQALNLTVEEMIVGLNTSEVGQ
jgi:hypothetical protein